MEPEGVDEEIVSLESHLFSHSLGTQGNHEMILLSVAHGLGDGADAKGSCDGWTTFHKKSLLGKMIITTDLDLDIDSGG